MIAFPNSKINLGLQVIGKRPDGFHNLQTVFYPLPLTDALELIRCDDSTSPSADQFNTTGLPINSSADENLCMKAVKLLRQDFPAIGTVSVHLHKVIPMGAGLGGGSSDASFMLQLLNDVFSLDLSKEQLLSYAGKLGSDCPFFIINRPCFAEGRGEIMEEIKLDLSMFSILLIHPGIHINTAEAFAMIEAKQPEVPIRQIVNEDIKSWNETLRNDFELPAFEKYPVLKQLKEQLYDSGAIYTSMTGSGSSFYAIYPKLQLPPISKKLPYRVDVIN